MKKTQNQDQNTKQLDKIKISSWPPWLQHDNEVNLTIKLQYINLIYNKYDNI